VLQLKAFQQEEWPPKDREDTTKKTAPAVAAAAAAAAAIASKTTNEDGEATVDTEGSSLPTNITEDESSDETEDSKPEAAPALSDASSQHSISHNSSHSDGSTVLPAVVEDDPFTREPVHPAIVATLEAFMLVLQHPAKQPKPCEVSLEGVRLIVKSNRYLSGRAGGGPASDETGLLHRLLESVAKCSESNNEGVQTALIATLTAIVTSTKCSVHENSMLLALRSTFHVYLVTKSATCKEASKRALLNMLQAVFFRMEAHDAVLSSNSNKNLAADSSPQQQEQEQQPQQFPSQYHADAYYLFRSLCKLSSKELPADNTDESSGSSRLFNTVIPTDPTELNSKILSLELILAVLTDYCGQAVITSPKFLYLVQHYLCVSLLKNCVSNHTQVAFLSQKIFLVLVG